MLPSAMGMLVTEILREYEPELTAGALVVVDETKSRVRVLPLSR